MSNLRKQGIFAALSSALFLGMTPVFGKRAIMLGVAPLAVVAIRTILAALLLLAIIMIFKRQYLYIYPAGLLGCLLAGWINGLGSLFFYSALGRIDASVGQLLFSLYPLFLAFWLFLDRQPLSRMTIFRLSLALPAVYLLTQTGSTKVDIIGIILMLIAAGLYALHIPINQRVLYDMPAPTVTLYTLLAMSAIVVPTFVFAPAISLPQTSVAWWPLLGLTFVTFFSRLTLFLGVKHLGSMQTALLGLGELLITIVMAQLWLGEHLAVGQQIGAALLGFSLVLVGFDKSPPTKTTPGGWLSWLSHPTLPGDVPWQRHD